MKQLDREQELARLMEELARQLDGRIRPDALSGSGFYIERTRPTKEWAITAYTKGNSPGNDVELALYLNQAASIKSDEGMETFRRWFLRQSSLKGARHAEDRTGKHLNAWHGGFTFDNAIELLQSWVDQFSLGVSEQWATHTSSREPIKPIAEATDIVSVAIRWPNSVEYLTLDLVQLELGAFVGTLETMPNGKEASEYTARCTRIERKKSGWLVELDYRQEDNQELAEQYDIEWGTSRFIVSPDMTRVEATFRALSGASTEGDCSVGTSSLYGDLNYAQVAVLLRPGQAGARKALLASDVCCAITGESEPSALQAAHLIGHAGRGAATPANMILLRADVHALLDAGKLDISQEGEVKLTGLPLDSKYLKEAARWNRKIPTRVVERVREALRARGDAK